ncbi:YlqD family protein [Saliterribacillus persicus]|uniref:YlqD protein n=1 Tax=Saliterribacillus persicus TaxID=930114 RepID=A0A368XRQ5_9BACI|nr:YlqD family protein [Saliterribacillus persicus]RCW70740.1 YlqD protein [Saliterribacillus persicus]
MQIIQKVQIKKILTDNSREQLREEYEQSIRQYENESQQLLFEQKKLEHRTNSTSKKQEITDRFQKEISNRDDHINWYRYKIQQLDSLPVGSEIPAGEVDALVEVEEGMKWEQIKQNSSITIEDGVVVKLN